jgi:hypothetical protein
VTPSRVAAVWRGCPEGKAQPWLAFIIYKFKKSKNIFKKACKKKKYLLTLFFLCDIIE